MLKKLGMAHTNKSYYQKYAKINKRLLEVLQKLFQFVLGFLKHQALQEIVLCPIIMQFNASCQIRKCFGWEMKKKR